MKFADTSFLVALLNPKDQWHALAKAAASELDEPVLTTMWVLVELGDALSVGEKPGTFSRFFGSARGTISVGDDHCISGLVSSGSRTISCAT